MSSGSNSAIALRGSAELYQALFERANDAILIFEPSSEIILEANAKACDLYGFSHDDLVGTSLKALTKDVARGEQHIRQLLRDGKYDLFETVHFTSADTELHIVANAAVIDYHGRRAIVSIHRDISEMKRIQDALQANEIRFRSLITSSSDIVAVISTNARLQYISPQVERILGYSPEEVLGRNIFDFVHREEAQAARSAIADLLTKPGPSPPLELRLLHRDGRWIYCEVTGNNLAANRVVNGIVLSARDISARKAANAALRQAKDELEERVRQRTADLEQANAALQAEIAERKHTEEQLRRAQKLEAIGRLAGGVAHDFNNILMLIIGYATPLANRAELDPGIRESAENILKAAERATSLTRQLLAFGRKQALAPKVLDLNIVLTDFARMLPRLLGEDIELIFEPQAGLGRIKADPAQIELAVMNLALNARDAMPQGGTLTITTRNESRVRPGEGSVVAEYVVVAITDTGHGMDRKTQSRIFEPFFSTKGVSKGTGLGLASVHGIVSQSDGFITVSSEIGRGSTFEVYLPAVKEDVASMQNDLPLRPPTGNETILLVEDEPGIRELSRAFLENFGYTVLAASSGKEALEVEEQYQGVIHLLIADVVMPGMRGPELAAELKSRRPGTKLLYVSGFADSGITDAPVLEKPFAFETLGAEIRQVLDRPLAVRKRRQAG